LQTPLIVLSHNGYAKKRETGLHEVKVDIADDKQASYPELRLVLDPKPTKLPLWLLLSVSEEALSALPIGSRIEFSPLSLKIISQMSELLSESTLGGSGLIVDYGKKALMDDTLRVYVP
jgi:hypothetical protein